MEQKREPYAPNGWIIDIYKYLTIPSADFQPTEKIFAQPQSQNHYGRKEVVYGNYDRVRLRAVNRFSDYSAISSQSHDWFGTSQSILIYPLEKRKTERCFLWKAQEDGGKLNVRYGDDQINRRVSLP